MANYADLLEGWAMPEDLAKKVSETLNKKRTSPQDELADVLEEMARDIALIEPDPRYWGGWITHLLELLQAEADKDRKGQWYDSFLLELHKDLETRIGEVTW